MRKVILFLAICLINIAGLSAQKARVDSIIREGYSSSKEMKTSIYEANGTLKTEVYRNWDGGKWKFSSKLEHEYNPNKSLKTKILYLWNHEKGEWTAKQKYEYKYSGNTMIEHSFHYAVTYIDGKPQLGWWESESEKRKYENEYDTNKNLKLKTYYYWSFGKKSWEMIKRDKYEYSGNRLIAITEWVENSMMGKTELLYDKNNNLIEEKLPHGKVTYEYDKNGKRTVERYHPNSCGHDTCGGKH